jgi:hypothetical protein
VEAKKRRHHKGLWAIVIALAAIAVLLVIIVSTDDQSDEGTPAVADVPKGASGGVIGFRGLTQAQARRPIAVARAIQGTVCNGDVQIGRGKLSHPNQLGQANWVYYGGPREWQQYRNCRITITNKKLSPSRLCGTMVHEWGHLRGKEHVRNPNRVMHAILNRNNIPPGCRPQR